MNPDAIQQAISHCANARVLMNRAAHTIGTTRRLGIKSIDIGASITYLIADMNEAIRTETIAREQPETENSNANTDPNNDLR